MDSKRLILGCTGSKPECLDDLVLAMAANIESAFISSGAVPGEDYSRKDLFTLAQPFALEVFKRSDDISFFTEWD